MDLPVGAAPSPRCRAGRPGNRVCRPLQCRQIKLINALTGRQALARTSNTPGRTQELIFFGGASAGPRRYAGLRLCRGGEEQDRGLDEAHSRLSARPRHARPRLCPDRRAPRLEDRRQAMLDTLGQAAVSHEIVLTKCDQVGEADSAERSAAVREGDAQAAGGLSRSRRHVVAHRRRDSASARGDHTAVERAEVSRPKLKSTAARLRQTVRRPISTFRRMAEPAKRLRPRSVIPTRPSGP